MENQTSLVIFKPEALRQRVVGYCLHRFETAGLRVAAVKTVDSVSLDLLKAHYQDYVDNDEIFGQLKDQFVGKRIHLALLQGLDALSVVDEIVGPWSVVRHVPGTIRGQFAKNDHENFVHRSKTADDVERERAIWNI